MTGKFARGLIPLAAFGGGPSALMPEMSESGVSGNSSNLALVHLKGYNSLPASIRDVLAPLHISRSWTVLYDTGTILSRLCLQNYRQAYSDVSIAGTNYVAVAATCTAAFSRAQAVKGSSDILALGWDPDFWCAHGEISYSERCLTRPSARLQRFCLAVMCLCGWHA